MKTIKKIAFTDIQSIPQLVKDFLNQKINGFEDSTFSLEHFAKQIQLKQNSFEDSQRYILAQTFEAQLSKLNLL